MPKYIYELVKCPHCDKLCKSNGLYQHIKTHGLDLAKSWQESKKIQPKTIILPNGKFKCISCDYVNDKQKSVASHWWRAHTEDGLNHNAIVNGSTYSDGRQAWNKGLTKETDERVRLLGISISETQQEQIKNGTYVPRLLGEKARRELSIRQSLNNTGGKCKWYEVSGVKVQGTWERNIAIKLCELGIIWSKPSINTDIFSYIIDNKVKSYAPDFYFPEYNLYLEIKGYWWGNDKEKMRLVMEQHPNKNIIIIEKEQYKKLLECDSKLAFINCLMLNKM